jgi:hypothetical protein
MEMADRLGKNLSLLTPYHIFCQKSPSLFPKIPDWVSRPSVSINDLTIFDQDKLAHQSIVLKVVDNGKYL